MYPIIETERCYLRKFNKEDLPFLISLYTDSVINEFCGGCKKSFHVKKLLKNYLLKNQTDSYNFWVIIDKKNNNYIGEAGLTDFLQNEVELGYKLLVSYWNMGLATEVSFAILEWGFKNICCEYIVAVTRPENKKSQRVLKKIGMSYMKDIQYKNRILKYYICYKKEIII